MHDKDEQDETFNQDQQEMFQPPDTALGETRPRTPGEPNVSPIPTTDKDEAATDSSSRNLDNPDLL